jgi:hypothetical protein
MSSAPHIPAEMEDEISFWLAKSFKSVTSGSIELHASDKPALKIKVINNNKDKNKRINNNRNGSDTHTFKIINKKW